MDTPDGPDGWWNTVVARAYDARQPEPYIAWCDLQALRQRVEELEREIERLKALGLERQEWRSRMGLSTQDVIVRRAEAAETKLARCVEEAEAQQKAWLKHHAGTNDDDKRLMLGVILRFLAAAKGE